MTVNTFDLKLSLKSQINNTQMLTHFIGRVNVTFYYYV